MSHLFVQGDATRLPFANQVFDLVCGSPPYVDARLYLEDGRDLGIARACGDWVSWMLDVTTEALRVSKGLVLWVVAGKTEDWCYQPAPEGLLWEWWKRGGECHCFRPHYWHRVGIAGSGTKHWYRSDIEYILAFKRPGPLPYGDPKANGSPPKYPAGGAMSHRETDGSRKHTKRRADGEMDVQSYTPPDIANPGNLLSVKVGGGHLGHPAAHENEAPYPIDVPAFFIRSHCPPAGIVLDPFSGSGTTVDAAIREGRRAIGGDLRMSQCLLGKRRLDRPHAPILRAAKPEDEMSLFSGLEVAS